jgi:hypothetical protein
MSTKLQHSLKNLSPLPEESLRFPGRIPELITLDSHNTLQRLKLFDYRADGWSGAIMTSYNQHGSASSEALKGKDDYVRTVLLTELLADHLPKLPWFLRNLQCALEDSCTVLEKVCAALETHPQICSDFIRIACMAEPVQPIVVPVDQLVVMLGKNRVWTTAMAAFLLHELNSNWSSRAQKEVASIAVARAYKSLVTAREDDDQAPEAAYVSGILSIIGLMPLLHMSGETDYVPDWLDVSAEAAGKQRETFGTDFLEIGRWARLLWKLPLDDAQPEVTSQSLRGLSNFQSLPKELYSPVAAINSSSESRNLVLVSKGTV